MKEIIYPIRINKYLAYKNITTRREADDFIKKGLVKINNKQASLGDMVDENDNVNVDESFLEKREFSYLVFNKPKGIVTHSPQKGEKGILDIIDFSKKVFSCSNGSRLIKFFRLEDWTKILPGL
jgi:16S rRNA U516 pseudouridylate synthase RsuA-like enzyme